MIDDLVFVMAVAVISLTMLLTPLLARIGNRLALQVAEQASEVHERFRYQAEGDEADARVVIAGYGRVGHTVGTILGSSGIPYVAFDTDAVLVAKWRSEGHPVFYGDIADPQLLGNASLHRVGLVVLTIDDGPAAVRAATLIRSHVPQMTIVARARDLVTCDALHRVGVNPVSYTHLDVYKRQCVHICSSPAWSRCCWRPAAARRRRPSGSRRSRSNGQPAARKPTTW